MSYDAKKLTKRFEKILTFKRNPFLTPGFSMQEFSKLLGVNRTYVSQFISSELNTTFHYLVRDIRLQHAEMLMSQNPEMLLNDILKACGFANDTSFRRAYKDKYGCLPSETRQQRINSPEEK